MKPIILSIIFLLLSTFTVSSDMVSGYVIDSKTGESIEFASIVVLQSKQYAITDEHGRWTMNLDKGRYSAVVSYVGYRSDTVAITVPSITLITVRLEEESTVLREVVITAREGEGQTSTSRIDRSAMEHLQPSSFTDLLELLPGHVSQNPNMGQANTITLRETGTISPTGTKTSTSEDYAITSLGTAFIVDGAPINNDATLSGVPSSSSGDPESKRNMTNRGVDMRSISTDNIESVEIVRGIPSAEYGNLTSGMVNIKRIRKAVPFAARVKVDEFSKLFSVGKGVLIGEQVLNFDGGYLDSRVDPRDGRENFKRANGSIRGNLKVGKPDSKVKTELNLGADYTGSFDNVKVDPDLNYNKIDEFSSSYSRFAFTSNLKFDFTKSKWLNCLLFNASASYQHDRLTRRKQVAPKRASIAPTTIEPGIQDGQYLFGEYMADFVNDGKPVTIFLKMRADGIYIKGLWTHSVKFGTEWSFAKNLGDGQMYDLLRPLSASWTTRPRAYKDIPGIGVWGLFAEDNIHGVLGSCSMDLQIGTRTTMLTGLDTRYYLCKKVYVDPRANLSFNLPPISSVKFMLGGGFGQTTKMPTVDYLYPQAHYADIIQLNYYDPIEPNENSKVILKTYIEDPTNYDLKAARNLKWEWRFGAQYNGTRFSITYFKERLSSGFRYSAVYDSYSFRRYDISGIVPGGLFGPPSLDELPYQDMNILNGYRRVTNGSRIDKQGVEYQLTTCRWDALRTSLIINGAWFRSRYSNSQMLFLPVTDVVNGVAVSDKYVGIYQTDEGRVNEQFNTNFMFDTQIPQWGLIFSTSIQCIWYVRTTRLRDQGVPDYYISAQDGLIHTYTPDLAENDMMLKYLIKNYNETAYMPQTVPPAVYLNLKATKKIGKCLKLSAFVNRLVDYLPDYTSNGLLIRRNSTAYFGMEANLTF